MKCPKCGADNPEGSLFCNKCGSPISEGTATDNSTESNMDIPSTSTATSSEALESPAADERKPSEEANPKEEKHSYKTAGIIVCAILVVIVLLAATGGGSNTNSNTFSSGSSNSSYSSSTSTNSNRASTINSSNSNSTNVPARKITSISADYSGSTDEGTVLNRTNAGITVTATYNDGSTSRLSSSQWSVSEPQTLQAGQTSTITIKAGDATTDLSVQCTSLTEDQFKASCEDISYDELLRNPDNYTGHDIHLRGKVFQSVSGTILMEVTQGKYGLWDDITMAYWTGSPNVIEDDIVSMWGTYAGTYTYTTAIGAQKTVPLLYARYVTVE